MMNGLRKFHQTKPLSPGIILGLMYVSIVYGRETWDDLIPNHKIKDIDKEWGIKNANFKCFKKQNPTLKYVIRRLRNSFGHGNINFIIPKGTKHENKFDEIKIKFHDENMKDSSDTFDATLTLNEIFKFTKKFQNIIHKHVRNKYKSSTS